MDWWKNKCLNQWIKIVKDDNLGYCVSNNCGTENFGGLTCFKNISDANREFIKNGNFCAHIFDGDSLLEKITDEVIGNRNISFGKCYLYYSSDNNSCNITCFKKNENNTMESIEWDKIEEEL